MHYKNVAAVVCRIMDHWFILHFIFFSLPTAIFTFYTTFLSQILVYHSFNFTVIFNLILLSICPCSCPHGLSPCIFLALIHISTGNIRMAHLIALWTKLSTLDHLIGCFQAFGISVLELAASLA